MNPLSLFGLFAVTAMLVCYALENSKSVVHPGIRRRVRVGIALRLSAGCMAFRVDRRAAPLASGERLTDPPGRLVLARILFWRINLRRVGP